MQRRAKSPIVVHFCIFITCGIIEDHKCFATIKDRLIVFENIFSFEIYRLWKIELLNYREIMVIGLFKSSKWGWISRIHLFSKHSFPQETGPIVQPNFVWGPGHNPTIPVIIVWQLVWNGAYVVQEGRLMIIHPRMIAQELFHVFFFLRVKLFIKGWNSAW